MEKANVRVQKLPNTFDAVSDTSFDHNIEDNELDWISDSMRDVWSTPTFWVVQTVSAYEGPALLDMDPIAPIEGDESPEARFGIADPGGRGIFVFHEVIRDSLATNDLLTEANRIKVTRRIVLHEVLHKFQLLHGDAGGDEGPLVALDNFSLTALGDLNNRITTTQIRRIQETVNPW